MRRGGKKGTERKKERDSITLSMIHQSSHHYTNRDEKTIIQKDDFTWYCWQVSVKQGFKPCL
jgi:hypothetical protein